MASSMRGQQHQAAGAPHQNTDRGRVARALDEVALPLPGHHAVLDLGRAQVNADQLGDLAAPSTPRVGGSRVPRPWRRQAMSWRRNLPLGRA